ncbi:MAG: SDR family NAD(P)-dependent oxidoreductase [Gammaproteobacteria bacterium]|nr:SDR family NAD(P)-dependent oxidoreductase [Gammaproteobacteria bacterium]
MDLGLEGRRGIVVGGSRGIGKAIAWELAREGVDLVLIARDAERLAGAASEIGQGTGRQVLNVTCDVRDRTAVEEAVAWSARELGGLEILVNSGSAPGGSATAVGKIDTIVDEDFLDDFNVESGKSRRVLDIFGGRSSKAHRRSSKTAWRGAARLVADWRLWQGAPPMPGHLSE